VVGCNKSAVRGVYIVVRASNDAAAMGDLSGFVETQSAALLRLAYVLTGQREAAEDLVQETLAAVVRHWRRVMRARNRDAYVRRMLINRHLSMARRLRWEERPLDTASADFAAPSATAAVDDQDALWRALGQLSTRQQVVLVLRYYQDLDDQQISETLRCRPATVRSLASRAMASLRDSPHLETRAG
jgi:RNA polymerase sigma-70 factor (sigma-E family)